MDRRLRYASGAAAPLNSTIPRVPPPAPLTRSYSSNAKLYGNTGSASDSASGNTESLRQLERYCETLEADHAELRGAFNEQSATVTSLAALMQEKAFKDTAVRSLETKVKEYEAFLAELHTTVTDGRGLRARPNPNQPGGASDKKGNAQSSSLEGAPSLDTLRQAVQQTQVRLKELTEREKKQAAALKQLETERRGDGRSKVTSTSAKNAAENADALMEAPASTKELLNLRQKILTLEQRLFNAEKDNRSLVTQLQKREAAVKTATATADTRGAEVAQLTQDLALQVKLLEDVRGRCLESERRLARGGGGGSQSEESDTMSNAKGGRLVSSSVSHLLTGSGYVRASAHTAKSDVETALTHAVSRAVHVPVANITKLVLQPSKDGLHLSCIVRHNTTIDVDALQQLLLAYPFSELEPLKEAAASAQEVELATVRQALEARVREAAAFQQQVRELEASVERLHRERSAQDAEVNTALDETATTVQALHGALKEAQHANVELQAALTTATERVATVEAELKSEHASTQASSQAVAAAEKTSRLAELQIKKLTAEKAALEQKINTLIATHAEEMATLAHEQQSRDAAHSTETDARLQALEKALRAAKEDARVLQTQLDVTQTQLREATAASETQQAQLTALSTDASQAERALDTALMRKANGAARRSSSSATQTLTSKARAVALDLSRVEKEMQEAKAELEREKEAFKQGQADALAAITKQSSQSVAGLQKDMAELKARLREAEQAAQKAERRRATELAAAQASIKTAEDATQAEAEQRVTTLQRELAKVQEASHQKQEELEMKIIALEGLLETEREQRELEKQCEAKKAKTAVVASADSNSASRELQREVRALTKEKTALAQQVAELETDLSDFACMREELQTSLDMAEKQLRAKKQDVDLLVKQLLRFEENERALKEENDTLRDSLNASPRDGVTVDAAGKPAVSSGLNAPSRLTPRRAVKSPKGALLKGSPSSPGTPVATAQTRVLKRNTSVKAFSRTASTPASPEKVVGAAGSASSSTQPALPAASLADAAVPRGVKTDKSFQRSHTATTMHTAGARSAAGAASTTASANAFEAPPRLNDFHRQTSSRGHYTNVQPTPLSANGRASGDELSASRRRPSSPAAVGARGSGSSGTAVLKRQPSATDSMANAGGAFKRTPSSFLAAAAGNSASFVRTASGYRRV